METNQSSQPGGLHVWGGHSCPPLLTLICVQQSSGDLFKKIENRINFKRQARARNCVTTLLSPLRGSPRSSYLPAACAAGFILAPLRGFLRNRGFTLLCNGYFHSVWIRHSRPRLRHISPALHSQNSYSVSTQLNFPRMRFAGQQIGNGAGDIHTLDRRGVVKNKYPLFAS